MLINHLLLNNLEDLDMMVKKMYQMFLNQYLLNIRINLIQNKELIKMMNEYVNLIDHEILMDTVVQIEKEVYQQIFGFDHLH